MAGGGAPSSATNRPLVGRGEVQPLVVTGDGQGPAQLAGPGQGARVLGRRVGHQQRLGGPDQHRPGLAVGFGDEVHAVVHAVDQVHVQVAGRAEHDRRPWRGAAAGVRGQVARAQVGLDLDDAGGAHQRARRPRARCSLPSRSRDTRSVGRAKNAAGQGRRSRGAPAFTAAGKQQPIAVDGVGQAVQPRVGQHGDQHRLGGLAVGRRDPVAPPAAGSAGTGTRSG